MLSWWSEYVNNHRDKREEVIQFIIIKTKYICKVIIGNQVMSVWILISLSVFLLPGIMSLSNIWWLCDGYRPDSELMPVQCAAGRVIPSGVSRGIYVREIFSECQTDLLVIEWQTQVSKLQCIEAKRLLPLLSFIVNIIVRLTREVAELIFTPASLPVYKIMGKCEDTAISIFSSWKCSSLSSSIYPQLTSYNILYIILCIFTIKCWDNI